MKKKILAWLLFHANRQSSSPAFYAIKNKLLERFGETVGYDIQFLAGKECFACNATGIYVGYYWESGERWHDTCNRCWGTGWFKRPRWAILAKVSFGKFTFHRPIESFYTEVGAINFVTEKGTLARSRIEGYIDHRRSKYGEPALQILYLLYDRKACARELSGFGHGWRVSWWRPDSYVNNALHIARFGRDSIPALLLRGRFRKLFKRKNTEDLSIFGGEIFDPNDLPF